MNLIESTRRVILVGMALFVIGGILIASVMGNKQDESFLTNNIYFEEVLRQVQEGNFVQALALSNALQDSQQSSETVNYTIGLAAGYAGEFEKGIIHMQRVLDINPHKVEDPIFMLQFAEMLVNAQMKDEAKQVIERFTNLPTLNSYPQYLERIAELEVQINN